MKHTTIDQGVVLQMALVGYEMERSRIEAAIAEIQAELGSGDSSRSTSTATDEPPAPRRKRFTARVWLRQNPQKPAETPHEQETYGSGSEKALEGTEGAATCQCQEDEARDGPCKAPEGHGDGQEERHGTGQGC